MSMMVFVLLLGLKPGQRKVLFTCLKRNDKREVKVAQLAGSVAEMSAYHHGEVQSNHYERYEPSYAAQRDISVHASLSF